MNNKSKALSNSYYMYGKHAVLAAAANDQRHIFHIYCTEDIYDANSVLLEKHKYEIATNEFITKKLGQEQAHQGIIAKVHSIFLDDIHDIDITHQNCKIAILDQVTDGQNIGAIIRNAAAFNISAIIMPSDNSPEEGATIAKTASGALEIVKIVKVTNLKNSMEYLKKQGFWIIGLDGGSKDLLTPQILTGKIVIALGAEGKGLRRLTKETCDYLVKIPMSEKVESLNVSHAAAISFYLTQNI